MNDFMQLFVNKVRKHFSVWFFVILIFSTTDNVQAQNPELFIESVYSPEAPYVQQPVRYTLRLWRDSHLQQGYFLTPDIPDTILLEDKENETRLIKKNGQEYEVLEQHYFLIPQKSGEITLPAPVFSSRNLFVKGKMLTLNVKPRPQSFSQKNWLIAKAIHIEQKWMFPEQALLVGEPVERTIIIKGVGIMGAQLPKIPLIDGVPLISENRSTASAKGILTVQNFFDNSLHSINKGELYGQRTQKLRYIADKPGKYSIPEITILWWNSQSEEIEKELIPGESFSVEQGTPLNNYKSFAKSEKNSQETSFYYELLLKLKNIKWETLYTTLIVSSIIVLLVLLEKKYKRLNNVFNIIRSLFQTRLLNAYRTYKLQFRLKKACNHNDCFQVKSILLEWAEIQYPDQSFLNLVSLSAMTQSQAITESLSKIDKCLYGNSAMKIIDSQTQSSLVSFVRTSNTLTIPNNKWLQLPQFWPHQSGS